MALSNRRLGAFSFAAGALAVIAGTLFARRKTLPALPAPQSPREWEAGQGAPVALADADARDPSKGEGHVPTDLLAAEPVTISTRAPDAFRPDPTAPVSDADREALRPPPPLQSAAQAVAHGERAEAV